MIDFIKIDSKKTRAFGWIQDSGNLDSLCNVVAIFDSTSSFHNQLVKNTIPRLVKDLSLKTIMISELNKDTISLNYKLLIGSHTNPRSESPCDGIIQAAVKGQKRDYIGDWPADNFVLWAQAFGFISYDYSTDSFLITPNGKELVESNNKNEVLIQSALAYPPAYRILSLLENPNTILTKFELGQQLGFTGEEGFISYPLPSIIAAMSSTTNASERNDIRSNWESSSDKYARTISQWLVSLGLLDNDKKEISIQYGNQIVCETLGGFKITPVGERYLRNSKGNSRHGKLQKIVSYEMFATKGNDREYLRLRRSLILKYLVAKKKCSINDICLFLNDNNLSESDSTVKDDVLGFINLGIDVEINNSLITLNDEISDFRIPIYKDLTKKSELSKEKDELRLKLKNISHEYLSLVDLAFDSTQNRLFEIKAMDLFINEYGFYGKHLGGSNKPDGAIFSTDETTYGIIVDMKAYSKGYPLPIDQRREMGDYISQNRERNIKTNSTEWWKIFPKSLNKFYFMFVAGTFTGDISEKLEEISLKYNMNGTAMSITTALLAADKIKGGNMTLQDFSKGILNTEYK